MSVRDRYTIREEAYERKYIPYDDNKYEYEDPTCRTIDLFNKNLSTWEYEFKKNPDEAITKLLENTKDLSSILTNISDKSLFEIDDILYENYEVSQFREGSSKYLDYLAMEDYNKCYKMILEMGYSNHELDTFYLRLAENLGGIHFNWIFYELGRSKDERKICLFLKIFKSCLKVKDDKALFIIKDFADELGFPFFLLKLQQFPQPSDSKNKRIVEFIKKQADDCLDILNNTQMLKGPKKFIEDSISIFLENEDYHWPTHYQYILLDVFMSAININERKEFLKAFLRALNTPCTEMLSVYDVFRLIFESVSKNLISIAGDIVIDKCYEEDMRYIDQHCGYNIGTYWSECVDKSLKDAKNHHVEDNRLDVIVNTDSQIKSDEETCSSILDIAVGITDIVQSNYFGDCFSDPPLEFHCYTERPCDISKNHDKSFDKSDVNSFLEESDIDSQKYHSVRCYFKNLKVKTIDLKDEYIFKKFLLYDNFMKCLHLMSILYTAITEYEVLFKDEPLLVQKPVHEYIEYCRMYFRNMLYSDLLNKKVSWPLEMAVTKCPFLYLNKSAFHLKKEYLKNLKGEYIDEATEKEIFGYIRKDLCKGSSGIKWM